MITICFSCPACEAENNNQGAARFLASPAPAVLHHKFPCRDCWSLREWARGVLRSRGEWVDPPEWR